MIKSIRLLKHLIKIMEYQL